MSNCLVLEICVQSVDHAVAAERGGAARIELCSDLPSGGVTPSAGLMQTVRRNLNIPIHLLVRPRAGDFCYSEHEIEIMRADIQVAKQHGMNGIVLGILGADNRVDIERTRELVELARPLPVTFHRAFDESCSNSPNDSRNNAHSGSPNNDVCDLKESLEDVLTTGAVRILSSGGKVMATDALVTLNGLVRVSNGRAVVMPCGGINAENVARIVQATGAQEFHSSAGTSQLRIVPRQSTDENVMRVSAQDFEQRVASLVSAIHSIAPATPAGQQNGRESELRMK